MILAGDIGGTKTLLGLFTPEGARPTSVDVREFPTLDYPGLPAIVDAFLSAQTTRPRIDAAAFGVAGPVINQTADMTNVPWRVDAAELSGGFALPRTRLLNDMEAMAFGVTVLNAGELHQLQAGERAEGNLALVAAGTGLGTSLIHRIEGRFIPIASEGGHTDFAARTDREIELVKFLRARFGRVEIEHVLCGPGLINLADFTHQHGRCAALTGGPEPPDIPAQVSKSALERGCDCCVEALDLFVSTYGAVAGNLALFGVTRGGVFLGGGIAPRILPALEGPNFITAFRAKEPMNPLLEAMPVHVILNDEAALLGAAVFASQLI